MQKPEVLTRLNGLYTAISSGFSAPVTPEQEAEVARNQEALAYAYAAINKEPGYVEPVGGFY